MRFFYKKNKICGLIAIFFVLMLCFQIASATDLNDSANAITYQNPKNSAPIAGTRQWLNNTSFDPPVTEWYNLTNTDVLNPDLNVSISSEGIANFNILGKQGRKEISAPFDSNYWIPFNKNPYAITPSEGYGIDNYGAYCGHEFRDLDANQFPYIYWRYNVSLDENMADYEITYANLKVIMNASVDEDIDTPGDDWSTFFDNGNPQYDLDQEPPYDSAYFTVEISDMEVSPSNTNLIAENETLYLGNEALGRYEIEREIEPKSEQVIKDALKNALDADNGHNNFTIIIGISIKCADNYNDRDVDRWYDLRFRSLNLTFDYEKLIDEGGSVSWNQDGNKLSDLSPENYTVVATAANLKFQYKINKNWTSYTSDQNSEIKIELNGNPYPIIKLAEVNVSVFKEVNIDLDPPSKYVNLSIEVEIRKTFNLNESIQISIDNVTLDISYIIFAPDPVGGGGGGDGGTTIIRGEDYTPVVIGLVAGIIGLVAVFGTYQAHFKHPPMVRKIRNLKKKIRKGKVTKPLLLHKREELIKSNFKKLTHQVLEEKVLQTEILGKETIKKGGD